MQNEVTKKTPNWEMFKKLTTITRSLNFLNQ